VPAKLADADIFLNTSRVDNTPVSVLEAMASGMCIVSTDVGGIPHLLQPEQDALLVPTDDPEQMARAVRRIVTDANLARRLSLNARKSAEQFDWSVVTPRWEALLESVIYSNVKARESFSHL
jgi:glycosyltransferase involved in cell wall biosynthesis